MLALAEEGLPEPERAIGPRPAPRCELLGVFPREVRALHRRQRRRAARSVVEGGALLRGGGLLGRWLGSPFHRDLHVPGMERVPDRVAAFRGSMPERLRLFGVEAGRGADRLTARS
jgi:hypothetical protein